MSRRRYSKVSRRMWNDARFRSLSAPQPNAQTLFTRLLTGPELTNIPGIIPVGEAALSEALGWPVEGFREAFREVFQEGLAKADWEARLVWVPNAIKHSEPESPNVVASWSTIWDEVPECALKCTAWESLRAHMKARGSKWLEAFDKACPKPSNDPSGDAFRKALPKACPNQEQEQEQEQEEHNTSTRPSTSGPDKPDPVPAGSSTRALDVRRVFDAWLEEHIDPGRRATAKLNAKRRRTIEARLREGYPADRLIAGIRGVKHSRWHMGDNPDGRKYTGLETILRDGAQVEKFESILAAGPQPTGRGGMRPCSPDSEFQPEGDSDEYLDQLFGPEVARA